LRSMHKRNEHPSRGNEVFALLERHERRELLIVLAQRVHHRNREDGRSDPSRPRPALTTAYRLRRVDDAKRAIPA
jgi:hypothetical protein